MPLLRITTNVTLPAGERSDFLHEASGLVSLLVGKPEQWIMVVLNDDATMIFGGEPTPTAFIELGSIGLGDDGARASVAGLTEFVASRLGVPAGRIYVQTTSPSATSFGWNGEMFG